MYMRLLSHLPRRFSASLRIFTNAPLATAVGLFLCFFVGFADGVLMPFFALWAEKEAGISASHIGLLLACYSGGELLATPLVGGIADRVGRRPVLLISTAVWGWALRYSTLPMVYGHLPWC